MRPEGWRPSFPPSLFELRRGLARSPAEAPLRVGGRDALLRRAPQRLCWKSSDLPWSLVSQDGVEDGEQLSCDRDERDHFWLTGSNEVPVKGLEHRVVRYGSQCAHKGCGAHGGAAAADHALATPATRLARVGSETGETSDTAAVELAELGQFGEECAGQCLADTGDRSEQILLGAPDRRAAHHRVDVAIDLVELLLEGSDKSGQALAHPRIEDALLAMALGDDHLDDLPASGHKLGEQRCRFVGNGTRLWFYRLGEVRDHGRIDGIGLRALAD